MVRCILLDALLKRNLIWSYFSFYLFKFCSHEVRRMVFFPLICLLSMKWLMTLFIRGFEVFEGACHKDHRVLLSLSNRVCLINDDLQDTSCQSLIYIEVFFMNEFAYWQNFLDVNNNTNFYWENSWVLVVFTTKIEKVFLKNVFWL